MKLKDIGRRCVLHSLLVLSVLCGGMWLGGCDDAIYDYEGDCSVTYRVKFSYDLNMRWAGVVPSRLRHGASASGRTV